MIGVRNRIAIALTGLTAQHHIAGHEQSVLTLSCVRIIIPHIPPTRLCLQIETNIRHSGFIHFSVADSCVLGSEASSGKTWLIGMFESSLGLISSGGPLDVQSPDRDLRFILACLGHVPLSRLAASDVRNRFALQNLIKRAVAYSRVAFQASNSDL